MTRPAGDRRPRIALVINPGAGRGAATRAGGAARSVLSAGGEVTVLRPDGGVEGSLAALARAAAGRPDAVVVCGGDGIVHLAANVLAGGDVPLGVIPAGTGNDAADVLGMSRRPEVAARQVLEALAARSARRIDLGCCDGPALVPGTPRMFVGLLYAGFDSAVNDRANRMRWPKGASRYDVALAIETLRLHARRFRLEWEGGVQVRPVDGSGDRNGGAGPAGGTGWNDETDSNDETDRSAETALADIRVGPADVRVGLAGVRVGPADVRVGQAGEAGYVGIDAGPKRAMDLPATLVAVGNGPQYGGGKRIAPHARWDDGRLGVTVVGPVSRLTLARLAPTLPRAGHVGHPRVRLYEAARIRLDAPNTLAYADGEPIGPLPIRVWTRAAALTVLAPTVVAPVPV